MIHKDAPHYYSHNTMTLRIQEEGTPKMSHLNIFVVTIFLLLAPSTSKELQSFSISDSPWFPNGSLTLVSPNKIFAAGFRAIPGPPSLYTFSIWVQSSRNKTITWSLPGHINSTSSLNLSSSALTLYYADRADPFNEPSNNSSLTLTDSGNLILDKWNSFDSPTDTILPSQPIATDNKYPLSSNNYKLINASALQFNNSDQYWATSTLLNFTSDGTLVRSGTGPILASDYGDTSVVRRLTLDQDGNLRIYSLDPNTSDWTISWQAVTEPCTIHGTCKAASICVPSPTSLSTTHTCVCPPGYREESDACVPKIAPLDRPKFLPMDFVNFSQPNGMYTDRSPLDFSSCESECLSSPDCYAFAYKVDGTRSCILQHRPLLNGYWSPANQMTTYIKVAGDETDRSNYTGLTEVVETVCPVKIQLDIPPKETKDTARNIGIVVAIFAVEMLGGFMAFWSFLKKFSKYRDMARTFGLEMLPVGGPKRFSYGELKGATGNFSNALGRGAFGEVFKGELNDHRTIAVKRLRDVARGEGEFWAEVTIIARMRHLNLVRLWGFCVEKRQRMLVYEYVPNGSLNKHLFGATGHKLDWNVRYRIAVGVARAIAYLHEECFEWVLHCDIKPENILLTDDFCPKVSDFGLSKLASKEEKVKASTMRGTRGYMAPEWVTRNEPITAKADVYSFGMVLLDLVSGKRQSDFQRESLQSEDCYFPSWAFEKVIEEGRLEEVMDERIADSYDEDSHREMVKRMVETAMWCLQDRPEARPSMGKVAKMLEGTVEITMPQKITLTFGGEG